MLGYIKKSLKESQNMSQLYIHGNTIYISQSFTNKISITDVIQKIERFVPKLLMNDIDGLYVANIDEFQRKNRSFNAMYKDRAIYISPDQDNEIDLLDDVVHEIAHSLEERYEDLIYDDGQLQNEFLAKRKSLYYLIDKPTADMSLYMNPDYNIKFDDHLYSDLNYDYLRTVSSGLFYSPYAITSLKEYWANGFENYLLGDRNRLKDLSPVLHEKINELIALKEEY